MFKDFYNFTLLFILLTVAFAIVCNLNFLFDLKMYEDFFSSILTVVNTSLGNYTFVIFYESIKQQDLQLIGVVLTMLIVLSFNIIIFNLIIAILANTYSIFENNSNGLYLSKILTTRDEMIYDESYGAFLAAMPPLNFLQIPFIPLILVLRQKHPLLV